MPQLGASDVTYTYVEGTAKANPADPMREAQFKMLFPNSTNVLYTSGGIPLTNAKLGCPAGLSKFIIADEGSTTGYVAKWDQAANTIRLYTQQTTATTGLQLLEATTAATVASITLRVIAQGW